MAILAYGVARGSSVIERTGAGNGLQQDRVHGKKGCVEPLHDQRLSECRREPSRCRRRTGRRADRAGRHIHGRLPICAGLRQVAGRDQKAQPGACSLYGEYAHSSGPHRRQSVLRENGSRHFRPRRVARADGPSAAWRQRQRRAGAGYGRLPRRDIRDGRAGQVAPERRNRSI